MADADPTPNAAAADPVPPAGDVPPTVPATPPPPAAAAPRRRRWVRVVLLVLVLLIVGAVVLVAIAPTILSTRPVVNFALGKVNAKLNGHVEVRDVSLGWTSGIKIDGLRVFDAANAQIAQADHVDCPLPLYKAILGHYDVGHTVIDGFDFDAKVDRQGRLNFAQLVKAEPTPSAPPSKPSEPPKPAEPGKLPDVSGDVAITNARGKLSQPGKPTVTLSSLAATLKVPSINDAVTDHLDAIWQVGDGGPATHLVLDGTAAAVTANRVNLDSAKIHQDGQLTGLDLAALKPLLPPSVKLDTLAGVLDGHLLLDVPDGKSATLDASLTAKQKIAVGGPALHGDTYTTDTFAAVVPKLSAAFPNGLGDWKTGRITVGGDKGSAPISAKVDQGQLTLAIDVVPQALLNLAGGRQPGSNGTIAYTSHLDLGKLAGQLNHTAGLSDDVKITGGTFDQAATVALTPDRGTVTATTDLTGVAGTRDGKPVTIQPVDLKLAAADVGGTNVLSGLRDLSLTLTSSFAHADFHGTNIGDLTGTLTAQLQQLQAELAQFHDFGNTKLSGDLTAKLDNHGQLLADPHQAAVKADVSLANLLYADAKGPRVSEPLVTLALTGDLHGSDKVAVDRITDLLLTLKAGAADAPTATVVAAVPTATLGASPAADFQLKTLELKLPQLQKQFANVPPGEAGTVVAAGTVTGTAAGHYDAQGVRLDPSKFTIANLSVERQLTDGQHVPAITNDTVNASAAGTVTLGETKTVTLTDLSVADSAKIFDLHKGDADLMLTSAPDGVGGKGQLSFALQLPSVADILQAMRRTTPGQVTTSRLKGGQLSGDLTFTAAAGGKTQVSGHCNIPDLNLATPGGDTGPQMAQVILAATADRAAHTVVVPNLNLQSGFATVTLSDATVLLSAHTTPDELQKASLAVDVPNLKFVAALAEAVSAPGPAVKAGEPPPPPPLRVTAGTLSMKADVSHDGSDLLLNVPTMKVDRLAFTRGTASYTAKPITAQLAAKVGTGEGAGLMQQLRALTVTTLSADAGVATVSMPTPITVPDLADPKSATGAIKVDGDVADLAQLYAAYSAKPADAYPYRGHLTTTQTLAGSADAVGLNGTATVAQFQVMQGQQAQFTEDQLLLADDVSLPSDFNAVTIKTLSLDMHSSGALTASIDDGTVTDLAHQRVLHLPFQLKYDLAKLWPIVHPMLVTPGQKDEYADTKVTGQFSRPGLIAGSYPADEPFPTAVKSLVFQGGFAVASLEHAGLTVQNLDVPVTLTGGTAVTADPHGGTAGVATANGGQLDVSNLRVDLTRSPPRLSTAAKKVVLTNVSINPLFTSSILGKVINNPVFVGAQQATGLISLSFDSCDALPLGDLAKESVPANDGSAHIRFSMEKVHIGLPNLAELSDALNNSSFETNVTDATVVIAHGVETQQIAFVSGPYTLGFNGSIRLSDDAFVPMTVTLPVAVVLQKQGAVDQNLKKFMPDTVPVALRGTASHPQLDLQSVAGQLLQQAGTKAAQAGLGNLLGGNKNGGNAQQPTPGDIVGGVLGQIGKKKGKR